MVSRDADICFAALTAYQLANSIHREEMHHFGHVQRRLWHLILALAHAHVQLLDQEIDKWIHTLFQLDKIVECICS